MSAITTFMLGQPGHHVLGMAEKVSLKLTQDRAWFGLIFHAQTPPSSLAPTSNSTTEVAIPAEAAMALWALLDAERRQHNIPVPDIKIVESSS